MLQWKQLLTRQVHCKDSAQKTAAVLWERSHLPHSYTHTINRNEKLQLPGLGITRTVQNWIPTFRLESYSFSFLMFFWLEQIPVFKYYTKFVQHVLWNILKDTWNKDFFKISAEKTYKNKIKQGTHWNFCLSIYFISTMRVLQLFNRSNKYHKNN